MKIGELADRSGCLVETIRYYERIGLLKAPERAANNYRNYDERHSERLSFIRHCRALDMTIDEIRVLSNLRDHPEQECAGVNELLDRHISLVEKRIQALAALEAQLRTLRGRCVSNDTTESCAILRALGADPAAPDGPRTGN
ncbi:Cd(II)/Pb(II)-responsive transcriptional regulator [Massilia sp. LjRoot122]|uniref:Cd(II)/Pb(II)-responsive transcriptional regulator n=1 Tax=Massilia sp. LjRoot122 TaxID=3342257 RepID=UPI003ECD2405